MNVPQNTPDLTYVEQVHDNKPQPSLPGPNDKSLPKKSAQIKRNRGSTFPGTSSPAPKHFEGSKKQDWNVHSNQLDPMRRNKQKSDSGSNSPLSKVTESSSHSLNHNAPNMNNREEQCNSFANQYARDFPAYSQDARQERRRVYKDSNVQARGDRKPIPATFRKPKSYFARQSLLPPTSIIHWVEVKSISKVNNAQVDQNGSPNQRTTFDNSENQNSPLTSTVYAEKPYTPPVIVTSNPITIKERLEVHSNFTLNPKASNFEMVPKSTFLEAPGGEDEYVGYYMTEDVKKFQDPTENVSAISHNGHPMDWQLPDNNTVRRIPKELVERVPGKMNWDNGTFNIIREDRSIRSWGSWNSEDEAEVQARLAATGSSTSLQGSEKLNLIPEELSSSVQTETVNEQSEQVINDNQIENAHTIDGVRSTESNHEELSKCSDKSQLLGSIEAFNCTKGAENDSVGIFTRVEKMDNGFSNRPAGHNSKNGTEGVKSEGNPTQSQALGGKKPKSKGKKKKKTGSITLPKNKLESEVEEKSHINDKAEPALPLIAIQPVQAQVTAIDPPAALKRNEHLNMSTPLPAKEKLEITKIAVTKDVARPVFNYRDALLKKVETPQVSPVTLPNHQIQKTAKNILSNPQTQKIEKDTPSKPITPKAQIQQAEPDFESGPSTEVGLRRKFFLQPIPSTVTYHSLIQQLRGGMLEDIYVSGLSPHPSAWKGVRGDSENRGGDETRSLYGGFDDEAPGFFILDGVKVLVRWRHNDQRLVNPATSRAVKDEHATRCILLQFNAEAVTQWIKERKTVPGKLVKNEIVFNESDIIKKVKADIESWGMADSNLENVEVIGSENMPESTRMAENYDDKQKPKDIKVLVSFIKILSAVKLKRFLLNKPEYTKGGYCKVEYYKDVCAEPIDKLKAIRVAELNAVKNSTSSRRKKNAARAAKESIAEENGAGRNIVEGKDSKGGAVKEGTVPTSDPSGGVIAKEDKGTTGKKSAEGGQGKVAGGNKQLNEGPNKSKKTVVIGKLL
ncbi:uncharacterized protein H6S33_012154 [Morchella sextelata]|uniref:uncharacterized protein n=1 Tax=Morchella sextelata TaxID=1174677 RepID=UPI001D041F99|nr:uncharacterized protein H6S33_012154 [Morchella sextelata]KAH0610627.1 hypothetical protein H6S33_012154 [Morchella sextelata]